MFENRTDLKVYIMLRQKVFGFAAQICIFVVGKQLPNLEKPNELCSCCGGSTFVWLLFPIKKFCQKSA
jgi:hypothetical protein